jgi:hypothetical protein
MWERLRRLAAVGIALVLVASSPARFAFDANAAEPCHGGSPSSAAAAPSHADTHASSAHPASHEHSEKAPNEKAPNAGPGFKCCGICTAASTFIPAEILDETSFAVKKISYSVITKYLKHQAPDFDPGIPKRTV